MWIQSLKEFKQEIINNWIRLHWPTMAKIGDDIECIKWVITKQGDKTMKKAMLILVFVSVSLLSAQTKFTEFKIGIHNPAGAKSGFWGGLSFGRAVDNNIAVSTAIDIYRSSYTKETTINKVEITPGLYEDEKVIAFKEQHQI